MKEKIKKIIKGYLPGFITGIIVCGTVSVIAMAYFPSNQVTYENSASGLSSTDVQGAIDELYKTCTAKPALDVIEDLVSANTNELYTDEHGDIRYYGASPNNYVSFNNELWRIIGVIDGKIKIIKNKNIGKYAWASNGSNNWNNASLKSYLNEDYYNSINSTYKNMISEETYYLGGPTSSNYTTLTASGYYNAERDSSDYLYIGVEEWLQAPRANDGSRAAFLHNSGFVYVNDYVLNSYAVRPVLYLNTNVEITGGDGSQGNAFQLSF